ncbi:MAG: hypothetical protein L0I24_02700, partial [Pseudonocardia sp.]|nr:hypothetical protein [Pseudonocardia sp.]
WWSAPRRRAAVLCGTSLALATLTLSCVPTVLPAPPVTLGAAGPAQRAGPASPTTPQAATTVAPATAPAPATVAPTTTTPTTTTPTTTAQPVPPAPLVVGDSIVLGSADALRAALGQGTVVDAEVSRQFHAGPPIVAGWVRSNAGPVVVHLGSNGIVRDRDVDAVVTAAAGRPVVLVNVAVPRRWQQPDNAALRAAADRYPGRVVLVDWAALVAADAGLLGPDRVHPTPRGRTALAGAVRRAMEALL